MQAGESPEDAERGEVPPASGRASSSRRQTQTLFLTGLGGALAVCVIAWLQADFPAQSWAMATRYTARVSALFFLAAFAANPLATLWRSATTDWLLRERRGLGLGFCAAHVVHLAAVIGRSITGEPPSIVAIAGGSIAYVWLAAMALTSTDAAVQRIGVMRWRRLHGWGMHYLWAIFTISYLGRVMREDVSPGHTVLFTLMVYVMLLRIYQRLHPVR